MADSPTPRRMQPGAGRARSWRDCERDFSMIPVSINSPEACRALANDPCFISAELNRAEPNGHKYTVGETRTLIGLMDFPDYNDQQVKITATRVDGPRGKSYYVQGKINEV